MLRIIYIWSLQKQNKTAIALLTWKQFFSDSLTISKTVGIVAFTWKPLSFDCSNRHDDKYQNAKRRYLIEVLFGNFLSFSTEFCAGHLGTLRNDRTISFLTALNDCSDGSDHKKTSFKRYQNLLEVLNIYNSSIVRRFLGVLEKKKNSRWLLTALSMLKDK